MVESREYVEGSGGKLPICAITLCNRSDAKFSVEVPTQFPFADLTPSLTPRSLVKLGDSYHTHGSECTLAMAQLC